MRTAAFVLALSSAAAAQVTGTFRYQDRVYDAGGFTGAQPFRPVRQAEVEIVRSSDGATMGTGTTDGAGAFSVAGVPGSTDVFARVYARRAGSGMNASVRNNPFAAAVYTAASSPFVTTVAGNGTSGTVDLTIAGGAAPAFNIFDAAVKSFQYQATVDVDLPALPPLLLLYWEAGTANGTYFDPVAGAVFFLGLASDPDQYDDDILLHEIGHWVANAFSKDDTPGGSHTVVSQLDARLSWSEGWAHYWSAAVRRAFPGEYAAPAIQVDNFGSGNSFFDLEGPSFPVEAVMATNELAVGAALWDITDAANEGTFDLLSGNEMAVWQAVNDRIPLRTEITLEDFRAGLELEAPLIMADVTGSEGTLRILNALGVRYYLDGNEPNGGPGTAAPLGPGGAAQRTIFGAGDEDWYALTLTGEGSVQAWTSALGDGGNTTLELFASDGFTLLAANDDRAPGDPSSFVQASLSGTGTFFLRVRASTGVIEHGYYDLSAAVGPPLSGTAPRAGYCGASLPAPSGTVPAAAGALLLGMLAWRRRR